jgi:hypothetical protein
MKHDSPQWTDWTHAALALGASLLVLAGTGCDRPDNKPDAGTDAGLDAGTDAGSDAGTDAGSDTGKDAGTDAGLSCADTPHDAKLGTLKLEQGFTAAESAPLPEGISAIAAVPGSNSLYGLRRADTSLYSLGAWPDVALGAAPLFNVIAPEDRQATTFLSGYLTSGGNWLLTGYTRSGAGFPGTLALYNTASPGSSSYVQAPGNFSAAFASGSFLVNGLGLAGSSGANAAVHALVPGSSPLQSSRLATFPSSTAYSGATAVTTAGVAVFGYSDASFTNHLLAVAPTVYQSSLNDGSTFALDSATPVYSGSDLFGAATFGTGIALHRGSYDSNYTAVTKDVIRMELTASSSGAVFVGDSTRVLRREDTCTRLVLLTPLGSDLLVGVSDRNGRRLVRLQRQ